MPEIRTAQRITLVENLILNHRQALDERAIITCQGRQNPHLKTTATMTQEAGIFCAKPEPAFL